MRAFTLRDLAFLSGLGAGATLWTPAQLTTALWLDADDAGTITTVSGAVSQWNDKSGNARHVTQGTATARPAYSAASVNGRASVLFDGVNDVLTTTLSTGLSGSFMFSAVVVPLRVNPIEGYVVSEVASYSNYWAILGLGGPGGSLTNFALFDGAQNPNPVYATPTIGTTYTMIGVRNTTANTVAYLQDGTLQDSVLDTTGATPVYSNLRIGGQVNQSNRYGNARICEVVIMSSLPSTDDRQRLEGYYAHRWGHAASLPAGHPYKSTPPTV